MEEKNFDKQMYAARALSNTLDQMAAILPEGSVFLYDGKAFPLHGTQTTTEHLPLSGLVRHSSARSRASDWQSTMAFPRDGELRATPAHGSRAR